MRTYLPVRSGAVFRQSRNGNGCAQCLPCKSSLRATARNPKADRETWLLFPRGSVPGPMRESLTWRARKNRQCAAMTQETRSETQTKAKAGAIIVPVTLFEQNCTIIWCEATKKAVVIDPGGDVPKILEAIKQTGGTDEKIWFTQGLIAHAAGGAALGAASGLKIRLM